MTAGILGAASAYGWYRFGSIDASLAYVRGERLLVAEPSKSLEGVRPGESVVLRYVLTNLSGHPVTLIGKEVSCSCTNIEDFPITLAASETRPIAATVKVANGEPRVLGSIRMFTDDVQHPEIVLTYDLGVESTSTSVMD